MGFGTQNNNEKQLSFGFTFFSPEGQRVNTFLNLHDLVRQNSHLLNFYPDIHERIDEAYVQLGANRHNSQLVHEITNAIRRIVYMYIDVTPPTQEGNENIIEIIDIPSSPSQPPGMLVYTK